MRVAAMACLGAGFGLALATAVRNTAAAIGIGFVQLAVVESFIRGLKPGWTDWLITRNRELFVTTGGRSKTPAVPGPRPVLAVYLALALAAAAAAFRARDVT